ncbi:YeeE/YedE family protein [candidate division KSB1 bacterium]|nr:YeeE/YedE family protein [candidate division KSB1 bacterium]
MFEFLMRPWEWYVAGPMIGLFVPLMLLIDNRQFGISSSFLHFCSLLLPEKSQSMLKYDRGKNLWKFFFVIGIAIGALITEKFLSTEHVAFLPAQYHEPLGLLQLFVGGFLVGFGTRYANGCTSGHSIMGLSLMHLPSLKSTVAFFAGGLVYTYAALYLF